MAILWRILGIGTLLTALVAGGLFVYDTFVQANAEQEIPIETLPVETRDIEEIITCLGEVEPAVATEIKSEVTGRVSRVLVESGIEVQRGDPLVELDQNELLVEIEEAEHHIEASQLRLAKVKLDLDSKEELKTKGFLPAREFADAEIDYKLAENELKIQRARVQALKERLAKTTIRAPQAGVVLKNIVKEGMVISGATSFSEGTILMEVAQLNRLLVDTDVSEVDVAKLHAGMEVTLEFDSLPDLAVPGKITYVSPSAELENPKNQQSTAKVFPITVAFATEDPRVRPGMTAKVRVTISTAQQVLAARLPSLFLEDGKSVVYVKAGAEFARKEVEVGISDTDVVEIKSGLAEGDQLATRKPFGEDTPASSGGRGRRGRS